MSPRLKVLLVVAVGAFGAAGTAIGVTLATRTTVNHHRMAAPPFVPDPTAPPALAREVRTALNAWPSGTVRRLRILVAQHPASGFVRLELGLALALGGDQQEALAAFRAAKRIDPDSPSAVEADDVLHPNAPKGPPPFVPSFERPRTYAQALIARGVQLQAAFRVVSAQRAFAAAARVAPNDPEALAAAAVGLYDKDDPARAFSRLGPLILRFPHAQTIRFHLGLLLIYIRQLPKALKELRLAVAEGPSTLLAKRARVLLEASRKR